MQSKTLLQRTCWQARGAQTGGRSSQPLHGLLPELEQLVFPVLVQDVVLPPVAVVGQNVPPAQECSITVETLAQCGCVLSGLVQHMVLPPVAVVGQVLLAVEKGTRL